MADKMIRTDREQHARLRRRARDDETFKDVIDRLLDETRRETELETIIERVLDYYGGQNVAAIRADTLPSIDEPNLLTLTVNTGAADGMEDYPPIFDDGRDHAVLEPADGERHVVPIEIIGTVDGPQSMETAETTPIYIADDVLGAEPIALEDGIERLNERLAANDD